MVVAGVGVGGRRLFLKGSAAPSAAAKAIPFLLLLWWWARGA